jgi:hypothetical protein
MVLSKHANNGSKSHPAIDLLDNFATFITNLMLSSRNSSGHQQSVWEVPLIPERPELWPLMRPNFPLVRPAGKV